MGTCRHAGSHEASASRCGRRPSMQPAHVLVARFRPLWRLYMRELETWVRAGSEALNAVSHRNAAEGAGFTPCGAAGASCT